MIVAGEIPLTFWKRKIVWRGDAVGGSGTYDPLQGLNHASLYPRIVPLRLDADGVHRLTVNLHPVDLGPVQVIAEIRNGEINVQLSSSTDAGHESLRSALEDLRRELQQSGFSNTSLDLRQGNPQDQARQQFASMGNGNGTRGGNRGGNAEPAAPAPVTPSPSNTGDNSRLDIRA